MKTTINASIPIKEQLLSYQVANKQQPKICFNSYKGTIVIECFGAELYGFNCFNSYKGTIVILIIVKR